MEGFKGRAFSFSSKLQSYSVNDRYKTEFPETCHCFLAVATFLNQFSVDFISLFGSHHSESSLTRIVAVLVLYRLIIFVVNLSEFIES